MSDLEVLKQLNKDSATKFEATYKGYNQQKKNEMINQWIDSVKDDDKNDLDAISKLLKWGGKPEAHYCGTRYLCDNNNYELLGILVTNGMEFTAEHKILAIEHACKDNKSFDIINKLESIGPSFESLKGSPLYFAVSQQHNELIKWLLDIKKVDINSTPSSYLSVYKDKDKFKNGYPAIAACIEMLKERYRDWFGDRYPIDTAPIKRRKRRKREERIVKEKNVIDPKYWDLDKDETWINLCNLLQLLVSYGGDPFKNYVVCRQFGAQSRAPKSTMTWNVSLWHKRCELKLVETALIQGFKERISKMAQIINDAIDIDLTLSLCEVIGVYMIGNYYDQIEINDENIKSKFKDDDYRIETYTYNKAGDRFPCRTSGSKVKWDYPAGAYYGSGFKNPDSYF